MDFKQLSADLESQPITGYLHTGERLNVPLISHIEDNLYVGGCIHGVNLEDFFSHVLSLYKWEQYKVGPNTQTFTVTMYDSHEGPDPVEIEYLAQRVCDALDEGGNVLVHCQAGINRSNLVAGAALVKRGRTPDEAIALLREKRSPLVLANSTFYNFLRRINESS
jgi:protein-tyrosine phosphatase